MEKRIPLELGPWPPGRACGCRDVACSAVHWDWTFVDDGAARVVDEVNAIAAAQGSEEQGKYLLREVLTLLRRAQRGKCTVVETVDGERIGDVDRMDYGRSLVLELRCHVPLEGDPRGLLRIYFTEPQQGPDLLGISAERKDQTAEGIAQQDGHWRSAERRLRSWWMDWG